MKLPTALRLALVPIGVALAAKGLQYLNDENERLGAEIAARRAELVDDYTDKGWIFPACEHRPNTEHENITPCIDCCRIKAATEDVPSTPSSSRLPTEDPPVELHRSRPRIRVGAVVANAAAFGLGAYLSMRAQQWMQDRAIAAELVADAIRENESRPVDPLRPEPAPGTCGVFPAFSEPPTPCTLRPHETYRHSWEGGRGDLIDLEALRGAEGARLAAALAEPAPTPDQVWDAYAEPAAFNHDGPCDPDDCAECRRIRKQ